jgi:hypothetical protein
VIQAIITQLGSANHGVLAKNGNISKGYYIVLVFQHILATLLRRDIIAGSPAFSNRTSAKAQVFQITTLMIPNNHAYYSK